MALTWIRKVKRGRGDGVWGAHIVDRDEFGLWLFTPEQSLFRWTRGGDVEVCYSGMPDPPGATALHLIPTEGWWFARWQHLPEPHISIDICTPAVLFGATWSYDDLELDLLKFADGPWELVDEDEFHEARLAGQIDDVEADIARSTVTELAAQSAAGDALFESFGWDKLDQHSSEPHPPLTSFPT